MSKIRVSGNMTLTSEQSAYLTSMHKYLMSKGFPYHSVSVIFRPQDLGFHCIFNKDVKEKVTKEVIDVMENNYNSTYNIGTKFTHSFI